MSWLSVCPSKTDAPWKPTYKWLHSPLSGLKSQGINKIKAGNFCVPGCLVGIQTWESLFALFFHICFSLWEMTRNAGVFYCARVFLLTSISEVVSCLVLEIGSLEIILQHLGPPEWKPPSSLPCHHRGNWEAVTHQPKHLLPAEAGFQ